jgi:HEAT repeat protein
MPSLRETVDLLLVDPDALTRAFAVDLLVRHAHVFEAAFLFDKLKLASMDASAPVADKARLSLSELVRRGFGDPAKIRDMGLVLQPSSATATDLEAEQRLRSLAAPVLEPAMAKVAELATRPDHACIGPALLVLGSARDLAHAGTLLAAVGDTPLRERALEAIRRFRAPEGVTLVENALQRTKVESEIALAVDVLADLEQDGTVDALRKLACHPSELVRERVAAALGRSAAPAADPALIEMLGDTAPRVQLAAVTALGRSGRKAAAPAVVAKFREVRDGKLQAKMLTVLGELRDPAALPLAVAGLRHADARIKASAVEALARLPLGRDELLGHLVPLLADPGNRVRANAIVAVHPHESQRANVALRQMLGSKRPRERGSALWAAGEVQDPELIDEFVVVLNTEQDRTIVETGLKALDRLSNPRLRRGVARLLSHPNPAVQERAINAYARLSGAAAAKELDRLYETAPSDVVRSSILSSLGIVCDAATIRFITRHFKERDDRIIANAIQALDRVGCLETSVLVEPFLSHPSPRVRANVVVALWHCGSLRSASTFVEMLGSRDDAVLRSALFGLAQVHDSLDSREIRRHPLLSSALEALARSASPGQGDPFLLSQAAGSPAAAPRPPPVPRATSRIALDRTTSEERDLALALVAQMEANATRTREMVDKVLAAYPGSELALYMKEKLSGGPSADSHDLPEEVLARSRFLPLLSLEVKKAKARRDNRGYQIAYLRLFDRQLDLMRRLVELARELLTAGEEARAMDVARFIVSQLQWTQDMDLRLGMIAYEKADWNGALEHLLRAYVASGSDPALGVTVAAVAMKLHKGELARTLVAAILESSVADSEAKARATEVAAQLAPARPAS